MREILYIRLLRAAAQGALEAGLSSVAISASMAGPFLAGLAVRVPTPAQGISHRRFVGGEGGTLRCSLNGIACIASRANSPRPIAGCKWGGAHGQHERRVRKSVDAPSLRVADCHPDMAGGGRPDSIDRVAWNSSHCGDQWTWPRIGSKHACRRLSSAERFSLHLWPAKVSACRFRAEPDPPSVIAPEPQPRTSRYARPVDYMNGELPGPGDILLIVLAAASWRRSGAGSPSIMTRSVALGPLTAHATAVPGDLAARPR